MYVYSVTSSKRNSRRGFTLIEVLVAIAILLIGVSGGLLIVTSSFRQIGVSKETMIATYLANEGIEIVREIRDTDMINNFDIEANTASPHPYIQWDSIDSSSGNQLSSSCSSGCIVNANTTPTALVIGGAANPQVCVDNTTGAYHQHNTGCAAGETQSPYYRELFVSGTGNQDNATSTVWWDDAGGTKHTITVTESIGNLGPS